ncbi:polysaccharide deacetylase family protein [Flavobacterium sp. N2038]|uniref:polysaccharide deacetylase family protein n=1 Tax=Flavobacterium sp. N2038 TaxID=2986829 RepID=UPI002224F732|nr:polysaccharide deacetylase family protein [Flavobacterium sp. N2038]
MKKLPILMYHNVCLSKAEQSSLTISVQNLEKQFKYLTENKYITFHFTELANLFRIPPKSIILTFDDVAENQLIYVIPLLEKYNLKASFFIPFHCIKKTDFVDDYKDDSSQKIMSMDQLKKVPSDLVELGYHSYECKKYRLLNIEGIENSFLKCEEVLKNNNLKVCPAFACPYEDYPKTKSKNSVLKNFLSENAMKFGLRRGNRSDAFPFKDRYKIKRIDIKGTDNLLAFKLKLKFGRFSLF